MGDLTKFALRCVSSTAGATWSSTNDVNEVWYGPANEESEHFAQDGLYFYSVVVYSLWQSSERKEILVGLGNATPHRDLQ